MEKEGNYYIPTAFGQEILDYLISVNAFGLTEDDEYEANQVLREISNLSYDILETKVMIDWFLANGYDSFSVSGDGPINLAVLDPSKLKIVKKDKLSTGKINEATAKQDSNFRQKA